MGANQDGGRTLPELLGARKLMCSRAGVDLVREQVIEPFGYMLVPCDDAAVERVAMHIFGDFEAESAPWSSLSESDKHPYREDARAVLRAAGGRDAR
jgi:hypothetical protein